MIAKTTTPELIDRASDLLRREYLSTADAHILRRTLRLIEGRTGTLAEDMIEEFAA
jgi:hypothetical protein